MALLLLSSLLAAPAQAEPPIDNLTFGLAMGAQGGIPMGFSTPIEFTVTGFLLDFLAVEGRIGATPGYMSLFGEYPSFDVRQQLSFAVRVGLTEGFYGAVGIGAMYPYAGAFNVEDPKGPGVLFNLHGGYRIVTSERVRISPEVYLGALYLGAGVQFEWRMFPR